MRIVIALGGNALLRRGDPMTIEVQRRNIKIAAEAIAPLAAGHSIVIVHGNGPQVGLLSLQAEAYNGAEPYPLDVLDAGTQGIIGYLIQEELRSLLPAGQQLAGARLGWATVGLVAWFGPRGLASVVFALLALEELGSPTADRAVAVVIAITITVLLSVIAHGATAEPLAARYAKLLAHRVAEGPGAPRG